MGLRSKDESINAWFGDELHIEGGAMRFEGSLRVDGSITDGYISGETLIVGERARVAGRIVVSRVSVFGELDGRVEVSEEARIEPGGAFSGEMVLEKPGLVVEEGGSLYGRVRMGEQD